VLEKKPESFVTRVARLRELKELRATPVLFNDEAAFHRVANAKAQREAILPTPIDSPAVQLAPHVAPWRWPHDETPLRH
jgi:hypothetical protein